jgi:hypothetical protein
MVLGTTLRDGNRSGVAVTVGVGRGDGQMLLAIWPLILTLLQVHVQRCRGAEVQRCRGAKVQRCRGAEVQRCRGAEVQSVELQMCTGGAEVQRCRVAEDVEVLSRCREVQKK